MLLVSGVACAGTRTPSATSVWRNGARRTFATLGGASFFFSSLCLCVLCCYKRNWHGLTFNHDEHEGHEMLRDEMSHVAVLLGSTILLTVVLGALPVAFGQERESLPDWVVFPGDEWETISAAEAGLDVQKWNEWLDRQNPSPHDSWGRTQIGNSALSLHAEGT